MYCFVTHSFCAVPLSSSTFLSGPHHLDYYISRWQQGFRGHRSNPEEVGLSILHWPCWSWYLPPLFCLSRSEITGSQIYRPVNCVLTWNPSWPMPLCGYYPVPPASRWKQPPLWARRPTQHSFLYAYLFVHLKCNCAAVYVGIYIVLFCSVHILDALLQGLTANRVSTLHFESIILIHLPSARCYIYGGKCYIYVHVFIFFQENKPPWCAWFFV